MKRIIKNHYKEKELVQRRILFLLGIIILATISLIARLIFLQIDQHDNYLKKSESNQYKLEPIVAKRGLIFDRNGKILAENIPAHRIEITPSKSKDIDKTLETMKKTLKLNNETIAEVKDLIKKTPRNKSVPLKMKLSEEDIAAFYMDKYKYPEANIESYLIRNYPAKGFAAATVGYVARVNSDDIDDDEKFIYQVNPFRGVIGIEKQYEDELRGTFGYRKIEVDAKGKPIKEVEVEQPKPGSNITLTIDIELQKEAQKALGEELGAVVVIDPNNGEILALANNPSYDPNLFVKGITQADIIKLNDTETKPMFNRAIQGQFPLASTIKPFLALGALELNAIEPETKIEDAGSYVYPNTTHVYRDWKLDGHGYVNMRKAIKISCDTYFYELSVKLGINNIADILDKFGFGHKTNIDISGEVSGLVANPMWKENIKHASWFIGDTILSGIGQGFMLSTPLQLANATAIIANHGISYIPHLLIRKVEEGKIKKIEPQQLPPVTISDNNWNIVVDAMQAVVSEQGGTGFRFGYNHNYSVAAKTGTAQLYRNENQFGGQDIPKRIRNHSLFIGFSPTKNAKIAVAVIAENSGIAPQVARRVFDKYYQLHKS
jgi:penicillin-binding protein 2